MWIMRHFYPKIDYFGDKITKLDLFSHNYNPNIKEVLSKVVWIEEQDIIEYWKT